ncbi:hypothetical protein D8770_15095 [Methylobacterium sp. DB1607]|nr:hypothetical protein [Methylobacterium sp. DB1607]
MHKLAIIALVASATFGSTIASQARPALMPETHTIRFGATTPAYRDNDRANAKNPALPAYAQGRGQETGGPARVLIAH